MKKLIFLFIFVALVAAYFIVSSDAKELSPSGRRSKLLSNAIATKNDSVLFLDFNRVHLSKSEPVHFYGIPEYIVESSARILNPNGNVFQKIGFHHRVAMAILETKWGVDSVAHYLYNNYNSKGMPVPILWDYPTWDSLINNLEDCMSFNLLNSVKKLVIQDGLDNPFWLKRYLTNQEMEKIILENEKNGKWTKKWEKWIVLSMFGEPLYSKFLEKITDKEILDFNMINKISSERKTKFLKKLNLREALVFINYNSYYYFNDEETIIEAKKMLLSRRNEWGELDLNYLCSHYKIIPQRLLFNELKKRSLNELVTLSANFHDWSIPFSKYAKIIISKVSSRKDYESARDFFDIHDTEGDGCLALLNKKCRY